MHLGVIVKDKTRPPDNVAILSITEFDKLRVAALRHASSSHCCFVVGLIDSVDASVLGCVRWLLPLVPYRYPYFSSSLLVGS